MARRHTGLSNPSCCCGGGGESKFEKAFFEKLRIEHNRRFSCETCSLQVQKEGALHD